jgi:hypothetical protein
MRWASCGSWASFLKRNRRGPRPMDWYPWLVFGHIVGGFAFVLAHGASAMCAFRLRSARDPLAVRAMLDLSE